MKTVIVKELMVPIEEYATVSQDAYLYDAVIALEEAHLAFDPSKHKHRAVLALDGAGSVVGKLDMFDILMSLEPKYGQLEATGVLSRSGHSPELIKDLLDDNLLWSESLQFVCARALKLKVSEFMEVPESGVYIDENATLDQAMHQLVICRYQSLLVTREDKAVGVLRLSDVFSIICDEIKTCKE